MKSMFLNKLLAGVLTIMLAATGLPFPAGAAEIPRSPAASIIPSPYGRVKESHASRNGKNVWVILDAHTSFDAQLKIADLIDHLVRKNSIRTVYEEGYEGRVPVEDFFGFIPTASEKQKTALYLLDRLRIGGAEYARIRQKTRFELYGAEDRTLYEKNVRLFQAHALRQPRIHEELSLLEKHVARAAFRIFPPLLKEQLRLRKQFDAGRLGLKDFLLRLARFGLNSSRYPEMSKALREEWDRVAAEELFAEILDFENETASRLLGEESHRQLYRWFTALQELQKLNRLEMSPEEFSAVKKNLGSVNTQDIARRLTAWEKKSTVFQKGWERDIRTALRFYETALKREAAVERMLRHRFLTSGESETILIFGGFHADGILKALRRQGTGYTVVYPRFRGSGYHEKLYRRLMADPGIFSGILPANAVRVPSIFFDTEGPEDVRRVWNGRRAAGPWPSLILHPRLDKWLRDNPGHAMPPADSARSEVRHQGMPAVADAVNPWLTDPDRADWGKVTAAQKRFVIQMLLQQTRMTPSELVKHPEFFENTPIEFLGGKTLASLYRYYDKKRLDLELTYSTHAFLLYDAGFQFEGREDIETREQLAGNISREQRTLFNKVSREIQLDAWLHLFETNQSALFYLLTSRYGFEQEALLSLLSEKFLGLNGEDTTRPYAFDDLEKMEPLIRHLWSPENEWIFESQIRARIYNHLVTQAGPDNGSSQAMRAIQIARTWFNRRMQSGGLSRETYALYKKIRNDYRDIKRKNYQQHIHLKDETGHPVYLKLNQLEATHFALENGRMIFGDEMGVGKTPQALATIEAADAERVIIVASKTLLENWKNEIQRWIGTDGEIAVIDGAGSGRAEKIRNAKKTCRFILVNYEALRRPDVVKELNDWNADYKIGDEVHRLRNAETQEAKGYRALQAKRVLNLSGTTIVNGVRDLWIALHDVDPAAYPDRRAFRREFEQNPLSFVKLNLEINRRYFWRRTKADVMADRARKHPVHFVPIRLDEEQQAAYQRELSSYGLLKHSQMFGARERMRQILNDLDLYEKNTESSRHELSPKYRAAIELAMQIIRQGEKLTIYSRYNHVIRRLQTLLDAEFQKRGQDWQTISIHESQKVTERFDRVKAFQTKPEIKVFLSTYDLGGEGLTLTAASHVMFIDLPETKAKMEQVIGRVDRQGQTREVHTHVLYAAGTWDEENARQLNKKETVFDQVIGGMLGRREDNLDRQAVKSIREYAITELVRRKLSQVYELSMAGEEKAAQEAWNEVAKFYSDHVEKLAAFPIAQSLWLYLLGLHQKQIIDLSRLNHWAFLPAGPSTDLRALAILEQAFHEAGLPVSNFRFSEFDFSSAMLAHGAAALAKLGMNSHQQIADLTEDELPREAFDLAVSSELWGFSDEKKNSKGVGQRNWALAQTVGSVKTGGLVLLWAHNKKFTPRAKEFLAKHFGLELILPQGDHLEMAGIPSEMGIRLARASFVLARKIKSVPLDTKTLEALPHDGLAFFAPPRPTNKFSERKPYHDANNPNQTVLSLADLTKAEIQLQEADESRENLTLADTRLKELMNELIELLQKPPPDSGARLSALSVSIFKHYPSARLLRRIRQQLEFYLHQKTQTDSALRDAAVQFLHQTEERLQNPVKRERTRAIHGLDPAQGRTSPEREKKKGRPRKQANYSLPASWIERSPYLTLWKDRGFRFVYDPAKPVPAGAGVRMEQEQKIFHFDPYLLTDAPLADAERREIIEIAMAQFVPDLVARMSPGSEALLNDARQNAGLFVRAQFEPLAASGRDLSILEKLDPSQTGLFQFFLYLRQQPAPNIGLLQIPEGVRPKPGKHSGTEPVRLPSLKPFSGRFPKPDKKDASFEAVQSLLNPKMASAQDWPDFFQKGESPFSGTPEETISKLVALYLGNELSSAAQEYAGTLLVMLAPQRYESICAKQIELEKVLKNYEIEKDRSQLIDGMPNETPHLLISRRDWKKIQGYPVSLSRILAYALTQPGLKTLQMPRREDRAIKKEFLSHYGYYFPGVDFDDLKFKWGEGPKESGLYAGGKRLVYLGTGHTPLDLAGRWYNAETGELLLSQIELKDLGFPVASGTPLKNPEDGTSLSGKGINSIMQDYPAKAEMDPSFEKVLALINPDILNGKDWPDFFEEKKSAARHKGFNGNSEEVIPKMVSLYLGSELSPAAKRFTGTLLTLLAPDQYENILQSQIIGPEQILLVYLTELSCALERETHHDFSQKMDLAGVRSNLSISQGRRSLSRILAIFMGRHETQILQLDSDSSWKIKKEFLRHYGHHFKSIGYGKLEMSWDPDYNSYVMTGKGKKLAYLGYGHEPSNLAGKWHDAESRMPLLSRVRLDKLESAAKAEEVGEIMDEGKEEALKRFSFPKREDRDPSFEKITALFKPGILDGLDWPDLFKNSDGLAPRAIFREQETGREKIPVMTSILDLVGLYKGAELSPAAKQFAGTLLAMLAPARYEDILAGRLTDGVILDDYKNEQEIETRTRGSEFHTMMDLKTFRYRYFNGIMRKTSRSRILSVVGGKPEAKTLKLTEGSSQEILGEFFHHYGHYFPNALYPDFKLSWDDERGGYAVWVKGEKAAYLGQNHFLFDLAGRWHDNKTEMPLISRIKLVEIGEVMESENSPAAKASPNWKPGETLEPFDADYPKKEERDPTFKKIFDLLDEKENGHDWDAVFGPDVHYARAAWEIRSKDNPMVFVLKLTALYKGGQLSEKAKQFAGQLLALLVPSLYEDILMGRVTLYDAVTAFGQGSLLEKSVSKMVNGNQLDLTLPDTKQVRGIVFPAQMLAAYAASHAMLSGPELSQKTSELVRREFIAKYGHAFPGLKVNDLTLAYDHHPEKTQPVGFKLWHKGKAMARLGTGYLPWDLAGRWYSIHPEKVLLEIPQKRKTHSLFQGSAEPSLLLPEFTAFTMEFPKEGKRDDSFKKIFDLLADESRHARSWKGLVYSDGRGLKFQGDAEQAFGRLLELLKGSELSDAAREFARNLLVLEIPSFYESIRRDSIDGKSLLWAYRVERDTQKTAANALKSRHGSVYGYSMNIPKYWPGRKASFAWMLAVCRGKTPGKSLKFTEGIRRAIYGEFIQHYGHLFPEVKNSKKLRLEFKAGDVERYSLWHDGKMIAVLGDGHFPHHLIGRWHDAQTGELLVSKLGTEEVGPPSDFIPDFTHSLPDSARHAWQQLPTTYPNEAARDSKVNRSSFSKIFDLLKVKENAANWEDLFDGGNNVGVVIRSKDNPEVFVSKLAELYQRHRLYVNAKSFADMLLAMLVPGLYEDILANSINPAQAVEAFKAEKLLNVEAFNQKPFPKQSEIDIRPEDLVVGQTKISAARRLAVYGPFYHLRGSPAVSPSTSRMIREEFIERCGHYYPGLRPGDLELIFEEGPHKTIGFTLLHHKIPLAYLGTGHRPTDLAGRWYTSDHHSVLLDAPVSKEEAPPEMVSAIIPVKPFSPEFPKPEERDPTFQKIFDLLDKKEKAREWRDLFGSNRDPDRPGLRIRYKGDSTVFVSRLYALYQGLELSPRAKDFAGQMLVMIIPNFYEEILQGAVGDHEVSEALVDEQTVHFITDHLAQSEYKDVKTPSGQGLTTAEIFIIGPGRPKDKRIAKKLHVAQMLANYLIASVSTPVSARGPLTFSGEIVQALEQEFVDLYGEYFPGIHIKDLSSSFETGDLQSKPALVLKWKGEKIAYLGTGHWPFDLMGRWHNTKTHEVFLSKIPVAAPKSLPAVSSAAAEPSAGPMPFLVEPLDFYRLQKEKFPDVDRIFSLLPDPLKNAGTWEDLEPFSGIDTRGRRLLNPSYTPEWINTLLRLYQDRDNPLSRPARAFAGQLFVIMAPVLYEKIFSGQITFGELYDGVLREEELASRDYKASGYSKTEPPHPFPRELLYARILAQVLSRKERLKQGDRKWLEQRAAEEFIKFYGHYFPDVTAANVWFTYQEVDGKPRLVAHFSKKRLRPGYEDGSEVYFGTGHAPNDLNGRWHHVKTGQPLLAKPDSALEKNQPEPLRPFPDIPIPGREKRDTDTQKIFDLLDLKKDTDLVWDDLFEEIKPDEGDFRRIRSKDAPEEFIPKLIELYLRIGFSEPAKVLAGRILAALVPSLYEHILRGALDTQEALFQYKLETGLHRQMSTLAYNSGVFILSYESMGERREPSATRVLALGGRIPKRTNSYLRKGQEDKIKRDFLQLYGRDFPGLQFEDLTFKFSKQGERGKVYKLFWKNRPLVYLGLGYEHSNLAGRWHDVKTGQPLLARSEVRTGDEAVKAQIPDISGANSVLRFLQRHLRAQFAKPEASPLVSKADRLKLRSLMEEAAAASVALDTPVRPIEKGEIQGLLEWQLKHPDFGNGPFIEVRINQNGYALGSPALAEQFLQCFMDAPLTQQSKWLKLLLAMRAPASRALAPHLLLVLFPDSARDILENSGNEHLADELHKQLENAKRFNVQRARIQEDERLFPRGGQIRSLKAVNYNVGLRKLGVSVVLLRSPRLASYLAEAGKIRELDEESQQSLISGLSDFLDTWEIDTRELDEKGTWHLRVRSSVSHGNVLFDAPVEVEVLYKDNHGKESVAARLGNGITPDNLPGQWYLNPSFYGKPLGLTARHDWDLERVQALFNEGYPISPDRDPKAFQTAVRTVDIGAHGPKTYRETRMLLKEFYNRSFVSPKAMWLLNALFAAFAPDYFDRVQNGESFDAEVFDTQVKREREIEKLRSQMEGRPQALKKGPDFWRTYSEKLTADPASDARLLAMLWKLDPKPELSPEFKKALEAAFDKTFPDRDQKVRLDFISGIPGEEKQLKRIYAIEADLFFVRVLADLGMGFSPHDLEGKWYLDWKNVTVTKFADKVLGERFLKGKRYERIGRADPKDPKKSTSYFRIPAEDLERGVIIEDDFGSSRPASYWAVRSPKEPNSRDAVLIYRLPDQRQPPGKDTRVLPVGVLDQTHPGMRWTGSVQGRIDHDFNLLVEESSLVSETAKGTFIDIYQAHTDAEEKPGVPRGRRGDAVSGSGLSFEELKHGMLTEEQMNQWNARQNIGKRMIVSKAAKSGKLEDLDPFAKEWLAADFFMAFADKLPEDLSLNQLSITVKRPEKKDAVPQIEVWKGIQQIGWLGTGAEDWNLQGIWYMNETRPEGSGFASTRIHSGPEEPLTFDRGKGKENSARPENSEGAVLGRLGLTGDHIHFKAQESTYGAYVRGQLFSQPVTPRMWKSLRETFSLFEKSYDDNWFRWIQILLTALAPSLYPEIMAGHLDARAFLREMLREREIDMIYQQEVLHWNRDRRVPEDLQYWIEFFKQEASIRILEISPSRMAAMLAAQSPMLMLDDQGDSQKRLIEDFVSRHQDFLKAQGIDPTHLKVRIYMENYFHQKREDWGAYSRIALIDPSGAVDRLVAFLGNFYTPDDFQGQWYLGLSGLNRFSMQDQVLDYDWKNPFPEDALSGSDVFHVLPFNLEPGQNYFIPNRVGGENDPVGWSITASLNTGQMEITQVSKNGRRIPERSNVIPKDHSWKATFQNARFYLYAGKEPRLEVVAFRDVNYEEVATAEETSANKRSELRAGKQSEVKKQTVREALKTNVPMQVFVPYGDVRETQGITNPMREEVFSLAFESREVNGGRSNIRFVIYGADLTDESLKLFRDAGAEVMAGDFPEAVRLFGRKQGSQNLQITEKPESFAREDRVERFLYQRSGDAYAALLYKLSGHTIGGVRQRAGGYFEILLSSALRDWVEEHQTGLVISMSA